MKGRIKLGDIVLTRMFTPNPIHKRCFDCGNNGKHVWTARIGSKTIATIAFCPKCGVWETLGPKLDVLDANGFGDWANTYTKEIMG